MKLVYFSRREPYGVRCLACRHKCLLKENKLGLCGVRANINNKLYSLVYSRPLAIATDPIEKKPLFHFFPGSMILSIGTFGCNFRCLFCQNHEMSQSLKGLDLNKVKKIIETYSKKVTPQEVVDLAIGNSIRLIAYTYNEPTTFAEYFFDIAKIAKKKGLMNVLVTNGYFSEEVIKEIPKYIDALNIDLKSMNNEFYTRIIGAKLDYVLENIEYLNKKGVWIELTTLLIPEENDTKEELSNIAEWISNQNPNIPWHISRFFPNYMMLDKQPTPVNKLVEAYKIGKEKGLKYVYVGNYKSEMENTYCPNCNTLLIERDYFSIKIKDLDVVNSRCKACGEKISGVFHRD